MTERQQPTIYAFEELDLKNKAEDELLHNLIEGPMGWSAEDKARIQAAYELAANLHKDDQYKDVSYTYHLLRVANRITGYLHIYDADVVIAALLHDSVEDHSLELLSPTQTAAADAWQAQEQALGRISEMFNPRVADLVAAVTNPPAPAENPPTYEQWLQSYAEKVEHATQTAQGWAIKFADWCDNGLGIVHSELTHEARLAHYGRKYFSVLEIFEQRFHEPDIQAMLDPQAKAYVKHQLQLGRERLQAK